MFEELKEKNTKVFKALAERFEIDGMVVVCPTGGGTFKEDYKLPFPVYELVEILEKEMPSLRSGKKERVSVHYPCHYYTAMGLNPSAFDRVIAKDGDAELVKGELSKSCCGFAGMFSVKNPELSQKILRRKMEDYKQTGARKIITSCPGCVLQLTEGTIRYLPQLEVQHLADFVAERFITEEDRKKLKGLFEKL
jgi:glycolate oxidase iron-sulfur subunit